jgi:hypothetical protein
VTGRPRPGIEPADHAVSDVLSEDMRGIVLTTLFVVVAIALVVWSGSEVYGHGLATGALAVLMVFGIASFARSGKPRR